MALTVESQNDRVAREAAKHDRHATVFQQMGTRLIAAACQIQISNRFRIETAKGVNSFR